MHNYRMANSNRLPSLFYYTSAFYFLPFNEGFAVGGIDSIE